MATTGYSLLFLQTVRDGDHHAVPQKGPLTISNRGSALSYQSTRYTVTHFDK